MCHFANNLEFEVRDKDHAYTEYIGSVKIPSSNLLNCQVIEGWFPILGKTKSRRGELSLKIQFISEVNNFCFMFTLSLH